MADETEVVKTNLEQALSDILIGATETMSQAKDFIVGELPDVVNQVLVWHFTSSLLEFIFGILLLCSMAWVWIKYSGKGERKDDHRYYWTLTHDDGGDFECHVIFSFLITCTLVIISCSMLINITWLKIWLAPKLFMIEYAGSLLK